MLIAFEGVDGCGKTTQVELLKDALDAAGEPTFSISFPRYADPIFGDLIRRFLRGDLGPLDSVDPRLVALLFAGDRGAEAPRLRQALAEDRVVLCDRYFYSNLAYQAAKLEEDEEVPEFTQWLRKLEFGHYALPSPACSIYLDVHRDHRAERLRARLVAEKPEAGAVVNDIHEQDTKLQARTEEVFRSQAEVQDDLIRIDCQDYERRLTPEEVHARVMRVLTGRGLFVQTPAQHRTAANW